MMISDTQTFSSSLCVSLRTGEVGCPLYNRAEGGHKDCQQGETLRISSNEGTVLMISLIHLSVYLPAASV